MKNWIPASAGMTAKPNDPVFPTFEERRRISGTAGSSNSGLARAKENDEGWALNWNWGPAESQRGFIQMPSLTLYATYHIT